MTKPSSLLSKPPILTAPVGDPMGWRCDDPRLSFLAPQICLHQAVTASGRTASGVGDTPAEARRRALAETAETVALESPDAARLPRRFQPTRDGIAAAQTAVDARDRALLEACERRGVTDWWLGRGGAPRKLSRDWVDRTGIGGWLARMRAEADLRRDTALWLIAPESQAVLPVHLVIARSCGSNGQSPMLGYGCAPRLEEAARKAVREMLLMEICVMDDFVMRALGTPSRGARACTHGPDILAPDTLAPDTLAPDTTPRRQMADFAARLPALLPQEPEVSPDGQAGLPLLEGDRPVRALIDWLAGPVIFSELPVPSCTLKVAVCQPLGTRPVLLAGPGSPFVGETRFAEGPP